MTPISRAFDPWGPISSVLFEIKDSDFVQNAIASTGINIEWRPFSQADAYSHSTRIRALRRDISAAYASLEQDKKGLFAQIVVKSMLQRADGDDLRSKLADRLHDIGWTISQEGLIITEDALVREQFFPPNTEFDAYITIRDLLAAAQAEIAIVDAYISGGLLLTLRGLAPRNLVVKILTVERNLKPDFGHLPRPRAHRASAATVQSESRMKLQSFRAAPSTACSQHQLICLGAPRRQLYAFSGQAGNFQRLLYAKSANDFGLAMSGNIAIARKGRQDVFMA
jgi:hypothetical protein